LTLASLCFVPAAHAQKVTGYWDFDDSSSGFKAKVGQDGSIWVRDFQPPRDIRTETKFGSASSFGYELPDGDGGVMYFPDCQNYMGYAMYSGIEANGGGVYVNHYTLILDVLYPTDSADSWRSIYNTNECNNNDGDAFVNPDDGLGISGVYDGNVTPDVWHRIALAIDSSDTVTMYKYIDGEQVGTVELDGIDGRWTLYTASDGFPTLLLTDNDGDTASGYVSSIQIRDYVMSAEEIAALGGPSKDNLPGGDGVAGQWDFEDAADGLKATTGNDLQWFLGCIESGCDQDLGETTEFGSSADYGLPDLPDGPTGVMYWDAAIPCTGYLFPHGAEANGGGEKVNQYTIIVDIHITAADYFDHPEGFNEGWESIYTAYLYNDGDALLWIRNDDGNLGDDGEYPPALSFSCVEDKWLRIVCAVDEVNNQIGKFVTWADGTQFTGYQPGSGLDGKRGLLTQGRVGVDHLLFFSDYDYYCGRGFVSAIQVRDYTMTEEEALGLGGPTAAGIPGGEAEFERGDVNCDGSVDFNDIDPFVTALISRDDYESQYPDCDYSLADINQDGSVDFNDIDGFVECLINGGCP
jgi:hypothetical protein